MFTSEEYYKLYNDRVEKKYRELKAFLANFSQEVRTGKEKGFRERMLNFSRQQAALLYDLTKLEEKLTDDYLKTTSLQTLKEEQAKFFGDLLPDTYQTSSCNPTYMITQGGKDVGPVLSSFAHVFKEGIADAYAHRRFSLLTKLELYFEMHKRLLHGQVRADQLMQMLVDYRTEYGKEWMELEFHRMFDPSNQFMTNYVKEADLADETYLYCTGLPVTKEALEHYHFIKSLPEEKVREIADKLTLRVLTHSSAGKYYHTPNRRLVSIAMPIGYERIGKALLEGLKAKDLEGFISRIVPLGAADKYFRDHRYDMLRGLNEEQLKEVNERYMKLCQDNQALLSGSLARINIAVSDPDYPERTPRGKREQLLKTNYDQMIYAHMDAIFMIRGSRYPSLELSVPPIKPEEDYLPVFQSWIDHQLGCELQPERANQMVYNTALAGETITLSGRGDNQTEFSFGFAQYGTDKKAPMITLERYEGPLPGGRVRLVMDPARTEGVLHLSSFSFLGRAYENVKLTFAEGALSQIQIGEEAAFSPDERWGILNLKQVVLGLNMALLEKLTDPEANVRMPYSHLQNTCLSFQLGHEIWADFPYSEVRAISAVRPGGVLTDIMREGLFMPIGSDAMNIPLMRIYQKQLQ